MLKDDDAAKPKAALTAEGTFTGIEQGDYAHWKMRTTSGEVSFYILKPDASVEKVLARLPSSRVKLSLHDLSVDPSPRIPGADPITPGTLVRRTPGPRTFIMGHIRNPELLLEMLADCETDQN